MLKEGDKAPNFSLDTVFPDDSQRRISLADFADQTLVLYFYPKDSTPGCTREGQAFSAAKRAFEKAGATVVGVSRDSLKSHCSFRDKFGLSIPLATDPDLKAHQAYGAWGEKTMYGKKILGCIRSTFVIQGGRIARVFPSVKVDGHADAVLDAIGAPAPAKAKAKAKATATPKKKTAAKKTATTKKTTAAKTKKGK